MRPTVTLLPIVSERPSTSRPAAKHLLKRRVLESSISPTSDTDEICKLFRLLERIRAMDLAERRLVLAEKQSGASEKPINPSVATVA